MTLREKQSIFALNISKLIIYAFELGFETTKGEAKRPKEMQYLYYYNYDIIIKNNTPTLVKRTKKPRTETLESKHIVKLAEDINLFLNGKYLTDKESYEPLAKYWKTLHPNNVSGYDWGWDFNHFQMT